jgi:CheY-like chemotaxis protein
MTSILVIDDDALVREATQILLRARGYDVSVAPDGKSGIEAMKSGQFDLAIVDLFMPDMDGLQVIKAIRQFEPSMPMIAASGFMFGNACPEMPGFDAMASEAGAVSTLYKPLRPDHVLRAVEKALGGDARVGAAPAGHQN